MSRAALEIALYLLAGYGFDIAEDGCERDRVWRIATFLGWPIRSLATLVDELLTLLKR